MLTIVQKDLLLEFMPELAKRGVTRAVFRNLLGVKNHIMSSKATTAGVRFSDYPPASPTEMRRILIEAGFPIDAVDAAIDAASTRKMRAVSGKAKQAERKLVGGENLYALIQRHRPIETICSSCGMEREEIADYLRTNELWNLLRTFNALPRTGGAHAHA